MKKLISSILAASFIFSACAMNVMAAATRTFSVDASKKTDLEVGDEFTVSVKLNTTHDAYTANYTLTFDPAVFEIDTTKPSGKGAIENYIDKDWYNDIKDTSEDSIWGYYVGAPSKNADATAGFIAFTWGGNTDNESQVSADDAQSDYVIGKFKFKVKALPASGTSSVIGFGTGAGDNAVGNYNSVKFDLTKTPLTVNFKQTNTPWKFTITEDADTADGYIWKVVTTTKGDGDLSKFDVTFTDINTSETLPKTVNFGSAMSWNTDATFYVGLKTSRTVTAAWSAESTKDGSTITATIE